MALIPPPFLMESRSTPVAGMPTGPSVRVEPPPPFSWDILPSAPDSLLPPLNPQGQMLTLGDAPLTWDNAPPNTTQLEGNLWKKSTGTFASKFQKRWFVIVNLEADNGFYTLRYKGEEGEEKFRDSFIELRTGASVRVIEDKSRDYAFQVTGVGPSKKSKDSVVLAAENDEERDKWMACIFEAAIRNDILQKSNPLLGE